MATRSSLKLALAGVVAAGLCWRTSEALLPMVNLLIPSALSPKPAGAGKAWGCEPGQRIASFMT